MKVILWLAVIVVVAGIAIVCERFALKDAMNMYPRSKKPANSDYRKGLLKLQAKLDQEIAEAEALTVAPGDDDTLQRASRAMAELRAARQDVEVKLRAEVNDP